MELVTLNTPSSGATPRLSAVARDRAAGPLRIGLVQINNSFSKQNYFPYSIGLLQAYAQRHLKEPGRFEFMLPLYKRIPVEQGVASLRGADAVFFSTYTWNQRISLELARRIKAEAPQTIIVFGGPQVPNRAEEFLRANPFIDVAVHGEGEQVFLKILEEGLVGDWADVPSISFIDARGNFIARPMGPRLQTLADVPSPYLEGVFEPLMKANPDETWIVVWETNRGCPFQCTFCDWGSAIASKVYQFEMDRLTSEIHWFADHHIEFVFCADANFGMLKRDLDIVAAAAESKRTTGYPKALSVQNTKNATERAYQVQRMLSDAGMNKGVTVSFQSMDPATLTAIKRGNISIDSFATLQRRFTADRVETYSDMILGLPGETYDSFANGVAEIIDGGQHNRIQFNNLSILPNAEMGDPDYQRKYGMELVETKVVNIHGSLNEATWDIYETQWLGIATNSMPRDQWVRTRAFCWWAALLHFDKLMQIPLAVIRENGGGVGYRELVEVFSEGADTEGLPVLAEVRKLFADKAREIQNGGAEYVRSAEWLNIWWPADEYVFIKLVAENKLGAFYAEAEAALTRFLERRGVTLPDGLLDACFRLNAALIKLPFQSTDLEVEVPWNVWEHYRSIVVGDRNVPLVAEAKAYRVDRTGVSWQTWDEWCREVVWYGNKKGAYLYPNRAVDPQIAGHF